jgi:hypothetical protein
MADPSQHLLRTLGHFQVTDATNQVTVAATESRDQKQSLSLSWRMSDSETTSETMLVKGGWFVFVEDPSHVWVFDGTSLRLSQYSYRCQSDKFLSKTDKNYPEEVRDALPESYRKNYIP